MTDYKPSIDTTFTITTDTATLAIYDPKTVAPYVNANDLDWWIDYNEVEQVQRGEMTLINLQGDGHYRLRITSNDLTQKEKMSAIAVIHQLGVEISSGTLCLSSGEAMGTLADARATWPETTKIACANGKYSLSAYTLDGEDDANPFCVLILKPREQPFTATPTEPYLDCLSKTYLFRKPPKLKLGLTLKGKVIKTPKSEFEFCVHENHVEGCKSWPRNYPYKAILKDFATLKRGDRITFKSISIDNDNKDKKIIIGELISLDSRKYN